MYKKALVLAGVAAFVFCGVSSKIVVAEENAPAKPAETAPADKDSVIKEIDKVPDLKLGDRGFDGKQQIYRIKSAEEFKNLGGDEKFAFDFTAYDLVIVRGATACSKGKVTFTTENKTISFGLEISDRCTHLTRQLCWKSYSQAFRVAKDATIKQAVEPLKK